MRAPEASEVEAGRDRGAVGRRVGEQPAAHPEPMLGEINVGLRRRIAGMKNVLILVLVVVVVFLADRITLIENQRYALKIGLCKNVDPLQMVPCLGETQTRTSRWYHLYYALTDHIPRVPY
jgi:hypothetical protein